MKELLVISGKGGTGKTTVVGSFAALARDAALADADVDAPNLHLLLAPQIREERPYSGAELAAVDEDACTRCGRCEEVCRFAAVRGHQVDARRCEGCGVCALVCPAGAITMRPQTSGRIFVSDTRYGPLTHARLLAGAEATGRLVTEVRRLARQTADRAGAHLLLTDGSPGIGCPVIASLAGVDAALVVTEPSPSGIHDLQRVLQVAAHFRVPAAVCVNKWDINPEVADQAAECARSAGACVLGRVPFDEAVSAAISEGIPLVEASTGPAARAVEALWDRMARELA